ncbi:hypothetical protein HQ496_12225 [bacterium]|nr:hypothetical protein [bacterium]
MTDPNRVALQFAVKALGKMIDEVVFVGGAVAGVLITDSAAARIRPTKDVDCIVEVTSRAEYDTRIRDQLLKQGFKELAGEGIPICAWQKDGIRLHVMPTEEDILGFSSRWYHGALRSATRTDIGEIEIPVINGPYFLATKLTAFRSRGQGDFLKSHDIEDLIAVIDGRKSLFAEVENADNEVRTFIQDELKTLIADDRFLDALPGLVLDVGRDEIVLGRMRRIAGEK